MIRTVCTRILLGMLVIAALPGASTAQTLGTYKWQLQPYCNIVSVTVTQVGGVYRVEGSDDRCGASQAASVIGTAFMNPDGSIGMGLNIVAVPNGQQQPLSAVLSLTTLSATWSDAGSNGSFVFTPGAGNGGNPRPISNDAPVIPTVFRLESNGGFVAGGTLSTGTIPASGLGTRMMWHPRKAAFRAGHVSIPAWDDVNVGLYSAAFGLNTVAGGQTSTALGQETLASGARSVAYGFNTVASGPNSLAGGNFSSATGLNSVAFGDASQAGGDNAIAVGLGAKALSARSQAFGTSTQATGVSSMAIGSATQAIGTASLAAGTSSIARAAASVVFNNAESLPNAVGSFVWATPPPPRASSRTCPTSSSFERRVASASPPTFRSPRACCSCPTRASSRSCPTCPPSTGSAISTARPCWGRWRACPSRSGATWRRTRPSGTWAPTAQDFFSAFGLGESERHIGTLDADGVALAAVKALELRTRGMRDREDALADDQRALRAQNEALARENALLRARLERLEGLLEPR